MPAPTTTTSPPTVVRQGARRASSSHRQRRLQPPDRRASPPADARAQAAELARPVTRSEIMFATCFHIEVSPSEDFPKCSLRKDISCLVNCLFLLRASHLKRKAPHRDLNQKRRKQSVPPSLPRPAHYSSSRPRRHERIASAAGAFAADGCFRAEIQDFRGTRLRLISIGGGG